MPSASPNKGLLIFPILKDLSPADGITVKNNGIIRGFLENGVDVDVLHFSSTGAYLGSELLFRFSPSRFRRILQFHMFMWPRLAREIQESKYRFVWLRMVLITPFLAAFIHKLGKGLKRHGGKLILEYGAYPFVDELPPMMRRWYRLPMNQRAEDRAHAAADFTITYCGQETLDGLVNIPINNGFDLSTVPLARSEPPAPDGVLRIICVSSLKKWHAYDRLLKGVAEYLQYDARQQLHVDIIGDGPELGKLREIVDRHALHEVVTFHGFKLGAELDALYNQSHIAIGTLGFHRIGITNSSSLKNREYFGRGLPIVLSTQDKDMPAGLPFVLYLPEGEEPIDVGAIASFARHIYAADADLHASIRAYADANISWKSKTRMVLDYLECKAQPDNE